jgi:hypothetical protein
MNISINNVVNPETIAKADLLALKDEPTLDWYAEAIEAFDSDYTLTFDEESSTIDVRRYKCTIDGFDVCVDFAENHSRVLEITATAESTDGSFGFGSL